MLIILLCAGLLVWADRSGLLLVDTSSDYSTYHGRTTSVTRVIDGDTIEVAIPDRKRNRPVTRVRLWGIDSPELATADVAAQPLAEQARDALAELLSGRDIVLYLESHRLRGNYGRVLAHIQSEDDRSINAELLRRGLARADERWPHSRLLEYEQAQREAKERGRGLWEIE